MRRVTLILLLLVGLLAAVAAQAQTPFSLLGIGQNVEAGTARDWGRGWGLADRDTLAPGTLNPAALGDLRFLQLLFTGVGERTLDSGPDQDRLTKRTTLPNVRLAVPLREGRLTFQTGFNVKRSFFYETFSTFTIERFGQTYDGEETYSRDGNIYEIPLGLAWRPLSDLSLAASVNLVRGPVKDRIIQTFSGPLANDYTNRLELDGTSVTLAALWDAPGPLTIGATVTPGYDLDVERTVSVEAVAGGFSTGDRVSMPPEYHAGLALDLGRGWRLGADGAYAAFGGIEDQRVWAPGLRDEWTVGAGLERRLMRSDRGRDYSMPLRVGYTMRRWAYQVGGSPIDERVVSVGTGFPFRNWLGTIDMSLSYAWIGNQSRQRLGEPEPAARAFHQRPGAVSILDRQRGTMPETRMLPCDAHWSLPC